MEMKNLLQYDQLNLFDVIKNFPEQIRQAIEIGYSSPKFNYEIKSNNILILGMGGSAIGGDLLRSYCKACKGADEINISVNRNYTIPNHFDKNTLVIASSYSGGTEETLSALKDCISKGINNILCISSGGELASIAEENGFPLIKIPSGFQPRAALAFSFFPLLLLLVKSKLFSNEAENITKSAMEELLVLLDKKVNIYKEVNGTNPALELAKKLYEKLTIIYSSSDLLDAVNIRWRGQIQENAKHFACGNFLPEMNHNEINSFKFPEYLGASSVCLFLKDVQDHKRILIRFNALEQVLGKYTKDIISLQGEGKYFLTRMFDLLYLADWTSYYLAMLNKIDPTQIPEISFLKSELSKEL